MVPTARSSADLPEMPLPLAEACDILAAWMDDKRRLHTIPALGMAVVYGGKLCWTKTLTSPDAANPSPAQFTDRTPFRIASISKTFTGTAVMKLREDGALNLHDPVSAHLSWFPDRPRKRGEEPLTIWHLLTHTSALPRETGHSYWTDNEFPSKEQLREAARNLPPVFTPGSHFKYSNFGLAILGEVIEAVSGISYEKYLTDQVIVPLALKDTTACPTESSSAQLFPGFTIRDPKSGVRNRFPFTDCRAVSAAASFSSTLVDLGKYMSFHIHREESTVLSPASKDLMQRTHWVTPDWHGGRGLGFSIRRLGDDTLVGHEGWLPGHRSEIRFVSELGFGVAAFVATNELDPPYFVNQAFNILRPVVADLQRSATRLDRKELAPYLGRYRSVWGESVIAIRDEKLLVLTLSDPDPILTAATLTPAGPHRFKISSPYGGWQIGEIASFELDGNGKVKALRMGDTYTYPIEQ